MINGDRNITEDDLKVSLLKLVYPVGSIYLSTSNVNPSIFLGGEWQQIKDTFLLAAGDEYVAGTTGGEAEHILTPNEMPTHNHDANLYLDQAGYGYDIPAGKGYYKESSKTFEGNWTSNPITNKNRWSLGATSNKGGSEAHNNMPPYLTVYMWKRIS